MKFPQTDRLRQQIADEKNRLERMNDECLQISQQYGEDPPEGQRLRMENLTIGYDKGLIEVGRLEERLASYERGEAAIAAGGANLERVDPGATSNFRHTGNQERDTAARIVDSAFRSQELPDYAAERAMELVDKGSLHSRSVATEWATVAGAEAYRTAFAKVVMDPTRGHMLWSDSERAAYQAVEEFQASRGMTLTDSAGGYMVPLTLDPAIMLTSAGSIDPMRQVARQVRTVTDTWQGVTSAGVTAEWLAEAAQAADATPTLGGPSIQTHKGSAFVPFSFEVGIDAMNFAEELGKLLMDGYEQLQATAFVAGNGTTQPKGFVTALDGTASEVSPTTAETFQAADIYKLIEAVPARFRANAGWQANLSILNLIDQFETTNGSKKFPELDNNRLLRKPVFENSNMDGTFNPAASADNFILAAGDWKAGYVIVDRIGATIELIPNLMGANNRPTGQRGAFLWGRVGADVVNTNALRLLNVATAA